MLIEPPKAWKDAKERNKAMSAEQLESVLKLLEMLSDRIAAVEHKVEEVENKANEVAADIERLCDRLFGED